MISFPNHPSMTLWDHLSLIHFVHHSLILNLQNYFKRYSKFRCCYEFFPPPNLQFFGFVDYLKSHPTAALIISLQFINFKMHLFLLLFPASFIIQLSSFLVSPLNLCTIDPWWGMRLLLHKLVFLYSHIYQSIFNTFQEDKLNRALLLR